MTQGSVARAADVLLADGRIASIRPMVGEDEAELIALHDEVGDDNLRLRFFALNRESAHRYVEHLVQATGSTVATLVATVRNRIVAVATAERVGPDSAEVAFLVADERARPRARQPAARAPRCRLPRHRRSSLRRRGSPRERRDDPRLPRRGVRRLPQDRVRRRLGGDEHGGLGERDRGRRPARVRSRRRSSLAPLLYPETVAVVGVRRQGAGLGHAVLASILEGGFRGRVFVVHPEVPSIDGVPAFPRLVDVPEHVDLAIIAVPAARVLAAVEDAADAGVSAVVVISSGLGELGPEGAEMQRQMLRVARKNNIRLVGPNCLGVMSNDPGVRLNATFSRSDPPPGGLAVASQSGGVGIALLDVARELGLGVHTFISLGNKADVSGNDLLAAWIDDPKVTAAALYLESFGNAAKFARMARRFAERKPLLAVVGGRSAGGQRAGASHTAAAATPAVGVDALFAQAGVIACRSAEAMGRTALLLAEQPLPSGRHVAIVSNAGGLGVLAADAADARASSSRSSRRAAGPTRRARVRHDRDEQPDRPGRRSHRRQPGGRDRAAAGLPRSRHPARGAGADQRRARGAAGRGDRTGPCRPPRQARRPGRPGRARGRVPGVTVYHAVDHAIEAIGHAADYAEWRRTPHADAQRTRPRRAAGARAVARDLVTTGAAGWAAPRTPRGCSDPYGLMPVGGSPRIPWRPHSWRTSSGSRSPSRSPTATSCTRPTAAWSGSVSSPPRRSSPPPARSRASSAARTCPCSSSRSSTVSRSRWAWSAIPGSGRSSWWRPEASPPGSSTTVPSCCRRSRSGTQRARSGRCGSGRSSTAIAARPGPTPTASSSCWSRSASSRSTYPRSPSSTSTRSCARPRTSSSSTSRCVWRRRAGERRHPPAAARPGLSRTWSGARADRDRAGRTHQPFLAGHEGRQPDGRDSGKHVYRHPESS